MTEATRGIDRLVVPLDGSEVSTLGLVTAGRVARATSLPVDGLVVLASDQGRDDTSVAFEAAEREAGVTLAERHVIDSEDPASAIVDFVAGGHGTVVSMATRGHGAIRAGILGSVAGSVVRSLPREVILSGPQVEDDADASITTVHVCIDGSEISEAIVPIATRWAHALDARIDVVHVAAPFPDPHTPASMIRPDEARTAAMVQEVTQRFSASGLNTGWTLSDDPDVADEIVRISEHSPNGMLAFATHGHTGLARSLLGSIAQETLRRTHLPALVFRPSDQLR